MNQQCVEMDTKRDRSRHIRGRERERWKGYKSKVSVSVTSISATCFWSGFRSLVKRGCSRVIFQLGVWFVKAPILSSSLSIYLCLVTMVVGVDFQYCCCYYRYYRYCTIRPTWWHLFFSLHPPGYSAAGGHGASRWPIHHYITSALFTSFFEPPPQWASLALPFLHDTFNVRIYQILTY